MIRYRHTAVLPALGVAAGLLLSGTSALALEQADPAALGVRPLRVAEGDGKKDTKKGATKEEAKRDAKAAPGKAKQGFREMGQGIKNEFGKAKEDVKNPKKARKVNRPKDPQGG
ncbi:MAG TPA: hypothetical protein VF678_15305 [bacterium]